MSRGRPSYAGGKGRLPHRASLPLHPPAPLHALDRGRPYRLAGDQQWALDVVQRDADADGVLDLRHGARPVAAPGAVSSWRERGSPRVVIGLTARERCLGRDRGKPGDSAAQSRDSLAHSLQLWPRATAPSERGPRMAARPTLPMVPTTGRIRSVAVPLSSSSVRRSHDGSIGIAGRRPGHAVEEAR